LEVGDILAVRVGAGVGDFSVVDERYAGCAYSDNVLRMKIVGLNSFYLCAYLCTRYGKRFLQKSQKGTARGLVSKDNFKFIPIPSAPADFQRNIEQDIVRAAKAQELSASLFASAQALLESELGLDKLVFEKPVSYTARFSEVSLSQAVEGNRIDAQCFSPSALFYEKVLDRLPRTEKLLHLTDALIKGSQQVESPRGDVPYISIKHIQKNEVVADGFCRSYPGMPEAQRGDLLLAITGATIGKVGVVHRYDRMAFSGDLLAIRAREDIDPYYLQAFLTHRIGQVQLIRWITGSTNGHLAPRDVGRVVIPRLPEKLEAEIAKKTGESIEKVQESERLLDQAKRRVEELIEEAIER